MEEFARIEDEKNMAKFELEELQRSQQERQQAIEDKMIKFAQDVEPQIKQFNGWFSAGLGHTSKRE